MVKAHQDGAWASEFFDAAMPSGQDGLALAINPMSGAPAIAYRNHVYPDIEEVRFAERKPFNAAPVVIILQPAEGASFDPASPITFEGTADDPEDGPLTSALIWQSDLQGPIGSGGMFQATLAVGHHTITASATDSQGRTGSASVRITVGDPAPGAPTGLAATAGDGSVALDWADNPESDRAGYNVYRSTVGEPFGPINLTLVTSSEWIDTGVSNGTTYYYIVTAVDAGSHESLPSNEASATPTARPQLHVQSIAVTLTKSGAGYYAQAAVLIADANGQAVAGATVVGDWYRNSALPQSGDSGATDAGGTAVIRSPLAKKVASGERFTFKVTSVTAAGCDYDPAANAETQDYAQVP